MPIPTIPKSLYPFVPSYPGVPSLLRAGAQLLDTVTLGYLGASDALSRLIGAVPVKWGVFDSTGAKIADYDSVFSVGYQNDSRVSDYPIEKGSFSSYNKVDSPFDVVVTLNCGGTEDQRATFLTAIEAARKSLNFYTVVTPEYTYYRINFTSINVQRTAREGANMIIVQLTGREIREKASAAYSQPKDPAAFDTQAQGQVQIISDPSFDASGVV